MKLNRILSIVLLIALVSAYSPPASARQLQGFDATVEFIFTDPAGNLVGGACLFGQPIAFTYSVCDNNDGSQLPPRHASPDWNSAEGTIELRNHYSGTDVSMSYAITSVPEGYSWLEASYSGVPIYPSSKQTVTYYFTLLPTEAQSGDLSPPVSQSCEVVELYPGYPGYRGVVAGIAGRSDTACLSDLQSMDPSFSKEHQDAANREAARSLGITGNLLDWTWEAWMAIGAVRGHGRICYTCLWLAGPSVWPTGPEPPGTMADDRHRLMSFESYAFQNQFVADHGVAQYHMSRISDGELRVLASLFFASYPTAAELLSIADQMLGTFFSVPGYEPLFVDYQGAREWITCRSGYVPAATGVHPDDLTNITYLGILVAIGSDLTLQIPVLQVPTIRRLDDLLREWRADQLSGRFQGSFASFLAIAEDIKC